LIARLSGLPPWRAKNIEPPVTRLTELSRAINDYGRARALAGAPKRSGLAWTQGFEAIRR
jgi:hypothetical protein